MTYNMTADLLETLQTNTRLLHRPLSEGWRTVRRE
jgi:hypothetical protein